MRICVYGGEEVESADEDDLDQNIRSQLSAMSLSPVDKFARSGIT